MDTLITMIVFLGMIFNVSQQPENKPLWVGENGITQYRDAYDIGLLAHNYADGKYFNLIKINDIISITYENGITLQYTVTEIHRYKKLPDFYWTDLDTLNTYSEQFVWNKFYGQTENLVMQTCIAKGSNYTWGLLFIVAKQLAYLEHEHYYR